MKREIRCRICAAEAMADYDMEAFATAGVHFEVLNHRNGCARFARGAMRASARCDGCNLPLAPGMFAWALSEWAVGDPKPEFRWEADFLKEGK